MTKRVITSRAELAQLPVNTVILEDGSDAPLVRGWSGPHMEPTIWGYPNYEEDIRDDMVTLPATVLYMPEGTD